MFVMLILSGFYLFYDNDFFHNLNLLIIPVLVFSHIVLITQPNTFTWETPSFILQLMYKFQEGIKYSSTFFKKVYYQLCRNMNEQTAHNINLIAIALLLGVTL